MSCEEKDRRIWVEGTASKAGLSAQQAREQWVEVSTAYKYAVQGGGADTQQQRQINTENTVVLAHLMRQQGLQLLRPSHLRGQPMPSEGIRRGYAAVLQHALTEGLVTPDELRTVAFDQAVSLETRRAAHMVYARLATVPMQPATQGLCRKLHQARTAWRIVG